MLDIGQKSEETGRDIHHGDIDMTTSVTNDDHNSSASSVVAKHDTKKCIIRMMKADVDNDAKHQDNNGHVNHAVNDNSKSPTRTTTKRPLFLPPPLPHYNTRAKLRRDDDNDDDHQEGINVNDNYHNEGKSNIEGNEEDVLLRGRRRRQQQPGPKHNKSSSPQLSPPLASFPIMSSSSSLSSEHNNNNIIHTSNKNVNGKDDDEDKSIRNNNLNLSTKDKHGVAHKNFYGPYKHIRASLDYDYHGKGEGGVGNHCISEQLFYTPFDNSILQYCFVPILPACQLTIQRHHHYEKKQETTPSRDKNCKMQS